MKKWTMTDGDLLKYDDNRLEFREVCMDEEKTRQGCLSQADVHFERIALYSEGEYDRKAEVNGALGTEPPTCISSRFFETSAKGKPE